MRGAAGRDGGRGLSGCAAGLSPAVSALPVGADGLRGQKGDFSVPEMTRVTRGRYIAAGRGEARLAQVRGTVTPRRCPAGKREGGEGPARSASSAPASGAEEKRGAAAARPGGSPGGRRAQPRASLGSGPGACPADSASFRGGKFS